MTEDDPNNYSRVASDQQQQHGKSRAIFHEGSSYAPESEENKQDLNALKISLILNQSLTSTSREYKVPRQKLTYEGVAEELEFRWQRLVEPMKKKFLRRSTSEEVKSWGRQHYHGQIKSASMRWRR